MACRALFVAALLGTFFPSSLLAQGGDAEPATSHSPGDGAESDDAEEYDPHGVGAVRTEGLDDEQARARFRVGMVLYESGRFLEAAREFEGAYSLSRRGSLLFNAYLAYRDAGELDDAVRALAGYLEADPDRADAGRLRQRLAAMRSTLEQQQSAEAEQQAEQERLEAESERLAREAAEAQRRAEAERRRAEEAERGPNAVGFVVGGAGLGLMAVSLVTGLIAQNRIGELEDNCPDDRCILGFDLQGARDDADRSVLVTDVFLFSGIATLAVGVGLLFLGRGGSDDDASAPAASAACTHEGCMAQAEWSF